MTDLLFKAASGLCLMMIVMAWLKPTLMRYLLDKGSSEPSLGRIGQFTALVVSTWAFVALVVAHELTEWFFGAYMLVWAGANAASLALKIKGNVPPSEPPK